MQSKNAKGIWQRRFWEHAIKDDNDLHRHLDYIHFNPVKHGYCEKALDWPFSTFHNYKRRNFYRENWGYLDVLGDIEAGE